MWHEQRTKVFPPALHDQHYLRCFTHRKTSEGHTADAVTMVRVVPADDVLSFRFTNLDKVLPYELDGRFVGF